MVALSLLSFSLILLFLCYYYFFGLFFSFRPFYFFLFSFFSFFFFCKVRSLIPTCGGIIAFIILFSLGQCSNNEDQHTYMDLQLKNYNSKLEQDMTLYECLRRCTGICNESRVTCMKIMKVALPQYDVNYMIMQRAIWQWRNVSL